MIDFCIIIGFVTVETAIVRRSRNATGKSISIIAGIILLTLWFP